MIKFKKLLLIDLIEIKKLSFLKLILNLLFLIILVFFFSFLMILALSVFNLESYLISSIIVVISLIISVTLLLFLNTKSINNSAQLSINKKMCKSALMIGSGMFFINNTTIAYLTPDIPAEISNSISRAIDSSILFLFLITVVLAPILEEILFRGFFLNGLLKKYPPIIAISIVTFIFAISHNNFPQFVTALLIGGIIGFIYYQTKSVLLCIIIHFGNNISPFLSLPFNMMLPEFLSILIQFFIGVILLKNGFSILKKNVKLKSIFNY